MTTFFSLQPGVGEIDELTGNGGSDIFLLGQISASGVRKIFYSDGDTATAGIDDYASIADFNLEEGDKIQLVGDASDYSLDLSPNNLTLGTGIYFNDGESLELIAVVKGVAVELLSLDNASQFIFK